MADGMGAAGVRLKVTVTGVDEDVPRLVEADSGSKVVCGGEVVLIASPVAGEVALMIFPKGSEQAQVWTEMRGSDVPGLSGSVQTMSRVEAIRLLKQRKKVTNKAGPSAYKGDWSGEFICEGRTLILRKKLTSYLTLEFYSSPTQGWRVRAIKKQAYYQQGGTEDMRDVFGSLAEAVAAGVPWATTGAVASACSVKDSQRRAILDTDWAAQRPQERKADPKSALPEDLESRRLPWEPKPPKAEKPPKPPKPPKAEKPEGAKRGRKATVPPALSDIPAPPPPSCPTSTANIAESVKAEASALSSEVNSLWGDDSPELLARAGKLIKRASSLVESPLCTGKLREEAEASLRTAMTGYRSARAALQNGEDNPAENKAAVRQIAEQVALAAAKAGRACAGGKNAKPCTTPASVPVMRAPGAPAPAPTAPAATPKRGRKPKAEAEAVDPEKDKILMDAVAKATQQAMSGMFAQMGLPLGGAA